MYTSEYKNFWFHHTDFCNEVYMVNIELNVSIKNDKKKYKDEHTEAIVIGKKN